MKTIFKANISLRTLAICAGVLVLLVVSLYTLDSAFSQIAYAEGPALEVIGEPVLEIASAYEVAGTEVIIEKVVAGATAGALLSSEADMQNLSLITVQTNASVDIFANGSQGPLTLSQGENFTLDWISANVVSCKLFADGQGLGSVPKTGSAGPIDPLHPLYPAAGQSKTFSIQCLDLQNNTVSDSVVVSAQAQAPQVPSAPVISAISGPLCGGFVTLSWNSVSGATEYKIFRDSILLSTSSATSYTDQATPGMQFAYSVQAVNAVGSSPLSNIVTATASAACQGTHGSVDIFANGSQGPLTLSQGENFTLDWISANVVSCKLFADGQGLGSVPKTGSAGPIDPLHPLYPVVGGSKTYTITCLDLQNDAVSDSVVVVRPGLPICDVPTLTSPIAASGKVGVAFTYTISATSSATSSISYNASSLPSWLSFATSTGTLSGTPTLAGTFVVDIYAKNHCGESQESLTITISSNGGGGGNVTASLSANPSTITIGQNSTLSWSSTNATACTAPWTSATTTSGTQIVAPTSTTPYEITCTKNSQSATDMVIITVIEESVCTVPVITSPLFANGNVGTDFSYTFTATSTGTSTITYSVSTTSLPFGLTFSSTTQTISGIPTQSGSFSVTLSATNNCGEGTAILTITISSNGGGGGNVTASLSANPSTITIGQNSTLSWSSTNATACTAPWTSATTTSGTQIVAPTSTTEYSINCTNSSVGGTASTTITVNPVTVTPPPNTGGGGGRARGGRSGGSTPVPQVLGAEYSCDYLKDYLRIDWVNNPVEVIKLQVFLRELESFRDLQITGIFDQATYNAVGIFQERYISDILTPWGHDSSTSFVYILTKKKVNEIVCNKAFPLNAAQEQEIIEFRAFLFNLKFQGVSAMDVPGGYAGISQGQDKGQNIPLTPSILSPNGMEFAGNGIPLGAEGSTTGTSTAVANNIQNIAAAVLAGPQGLDESLSAILLFVAILLAIYLTVQALVENQAKNGALTFDAQRMRKMSYFTIGLFIAIIGCVLFGAYAIVLPLVTLLIIVCIATLWLSFGKKEVRTVMRVEEYK